MSGLNQPLLEREQNLDKPLAQSSAIELTKPEVLTENFPPEITLDSIKNSVDKAFKYNKLEFPFDCKHIKISNKHHLLIGVSNEKATIAIKHLDGSLKTREIVTTLEPISCIRLNKDETKLYLGTSNGKIVIYEFPSMNPETCNIIDVGTSNIYFDVMSYEIYAYDVDSQTLNIVDEESKKVSIISDNPDGQYVRISPNNQLVAISTDEYVTVYSKDMKWKDFVYKVKGRNNEYYYDYSYGGIQKKCEIEFSNASNKLGISYLNYIEIWDFTKDKLEKTLKLHTESDITSFKFSEDDSLLAAVGIDHSINIWDLTSESNLPKFLNYPIKELDKEETPLELPKFFDLEIDEQRNLLYTHALDSKYSFQWKGIFVDKVMYPNSTFDKHNQRCIVSKNQGHLLITDINSYKIQIWDIEKTDLIKTISLENAPKELSFGEENENFLYACTEGQIHIYNGQDYSFVKTIICSSIKEIYVLRTYADYIIIGGQEAKVIILNQQGEIIKEISEFKKAVSGMKVYKNMLITGDSLGNILIHNIQENWEKYTELCEHKDMIRTIEVIKNEDNLVTVGHDKKCIFWSINDKICIKEKTLDHEIDTCCLSNDEKSLILCTNEGDIKVYNLPGIELLMTIKYNGKNQRFAMDKNEKYLLISNSNGVFRTLSPTSLNNPLILDNNINIPNLRNFLNKKKTDSSNDTWIISPYMVNSLHYYADGDLKKELKIAMTGGSFFLNSLLGTPLRLALDNSSIDTAGAILSQLKKRIVHNRYALETLTSVICDLNTMGFKGLDELYSECLVHVPRVAQKKLPEFCSDSISLPIIFYGFTMRINPDNFFVRQASEEKIKITFLVSTISMNLEIGSEESISFLESLLNSPNTEIFKTKFIQTILNEKWKKIKWIPYLNGVILALYLVFLSIFIVRNDTIYLTLALVFNILTFLYEILQMKINLVKYWTDIWNYIDISRACFFYAYYYFICIDSTDNDISSGQVSTNLQDEYSWILIIVSILSSIRGITLFALSSSTRYMVSLLGEVIYDIIAFAVVVFYSILSFAFIKMAFTGPDTSDDKGGIGRLIIGAYFEAIGGGENSSDSSFVLFLIIINSIFNVIIMMNLLISILAGTYEKVSNDAEIEDLKELTEIIIEAENLYYHNRGLKKKTFLQICEEYNPPEIVPELDLKKKYKTVKSEILTLKKRNSKLQTACYEKFRFLHQKHAETHSKIDNSKKEVIKELKSSGVELKKEVQKNITKEQNANNEKGFRKFLAQSFVCLNGHLLRVKENEYTFCEICRKNIRNETTLSCDICKYNMCKDCVKFFYRNNKIKTEITCNQKHTLLHIENLNEYLEQNKTSTNLTCRFCNIVVDTEAFCCIPCLFVLCTVCNESYKRGKNDKGNSLKCFKQHKLNWKHSEFYKQSLRMTCTICQAQRLGSGFFSCIECQFYSCLKCVKDKLDSEIIKPLEEEDKENKAADEETKALGAIEIEHRVD
ncbi:hypothetical protein SteCoe_13995 [Stentor coeruleus]|uniref:Uncharacterized protein n=1 Tax=Stentor coeruleus TaxID=5963 RepID=A0A1R2C716_9CILI|nr:hypothetical protein SteCoe_13995 [Stentor coeruleus]